MTLAAIWYSSVYKSRCLDKQGTWHKLATISIYSYILCHREVIMSEIWMLSKLNKGIWHLKKFNYFIHGLDSALRELNRKVWYLWSIWLFRKQQIVELKSQNKQTDQNILVKILVADLISYNRFCLMTVLGN